MHDGLGACSDTVTGWAGGWREEMWCGVDERNVKLCLSVGMSHVALCRFGPGRRLDLDAAKPNPPPHCSSIHHRTLFSTTSDSHFSTYLGRQIHHTQQSPEASTYRRPRRRRRLLHHYVLGAATSSPFSPSLERFRPTLNPFIARLLMVRLRRRTACQNE